MYDTIHIRLDNPLVRADHRLGDIDYPARAAEALGDDTGVPASCLFVRYEHELCYIRSDNGYLYVQLSLPKWKSGGHGNVWPATKDEARQIFRELNASLAGIGIDTDVFRAAVVRLDIYANGATAYGYQDFKPLLDTVTIPRRTRVAYPDSVRFGSSHRTDIIYDKRAQQVSAGEDVSQLPPNLMRWEYRLLKRAAVATTTGVTTVEDLFTKWEAIRRLYIANLRAALRYDETLTGRRMLQGDIAELVQHRAEVERALYAKLVVGHAGSIDGVKAVLRQSGATRLQVYRLARTILDGLAYPLPGETVTLNDLKIELYTKLVEGLGGEPM